MSYDSLLSGFCAGLSQVVLLHPFDHALYLSSINRRQFIHLDNFKHPIKGITQSFGQRVLSGGLYFTLQKNIKIDNRYDGLMCGFLNGAILSPLSFIKSQGWNKEHELSSNFHKTAKEIYQQTKTIKTYFRGTHCTIVRDMIFSVVYELNRRKKNKNNNSNGIVDNLTAATYGTICSALPNFARNQIFNSDISKTPPTMIDCYKQLYVELKICNGLKEKIKILDRRVLFFWGVLRVVTGITLSQYVFDSVFETIKTKN